LPCIRNFRISVGDFAGLVTEGFWFEQLANFCGKLAVPDAIFAAKMNAYCNQLGLDIDLPSGSIAWAMECFEKTILTQEDTGGIRIEWGDAKGILD
jgi:aldehyde:ferredoxin oxidoreductase